MLKPSEFGLPEKFTEFRQDQFETSAKITTTSIYCYMLDAPTGSGKPPIAATVWDVTFRCGEYKFEEKDK